MSCDYQSSANRASKFQMVATCVGVGTVVAVVLANCGTSGMFAILEYRRIINGIIATVFAFATFHQGRHDVGAFTNLLTAENGWPLDLPSPNTKEDS